MGGTRSVSQESVRVRVKLSRRAVARASRPHPRPPRMGTRVGGTARLQSAAPTTHTRSVSRRRRADNPDRGDEGARRRQEGKKGLLDSRLREPLRPHSGSGASGNRAPGRASHSAPAPQAPHHPDRVVLPPRWVVPGTAALISSNLPAPRPPSGYRVLARRRPPTPASALRPGPTELRSGRSPTCSPRPLEHRDIKY